MKSHKRQIIEIEGKKQGKEDNKQDKDHFKIRQLKCCAPSLTICIGCHHLPIGLPFKDNLVRAKFSITPTQIVKQAVASIPLFEMRRVLRVLLLIIASPRARPPSCPKLL